MRNISPVMVQEFSSRLVKSAFFAEMFFDTGRIGMWTGFGDVTFDGKTFLGGGNLIGISAITETQDLTAKGIVVSLGGIDPTLISLALSEKVRGRKFVLYLGSFDYVTRIATEDEQGAVLDEEGNYVIVESSVLNNPQRIFSGMMDYMEYNFSGSLADIRLSVENSLIIGQRSKIRRYTNEDQKRRFPNDRGLEFINALQDKEVVW